MRNANEIDRLSVNPSMEKEFWSESANPPGDYSDLETVPVNFRGGPFDKYKSFQERKCLSIKGVVHLLSKISNFLSCFTGKPNERLLANALSRKYIFCSWINWDIVKFFFYCFLYLRILLVEQFFKRIFCCNVQQDRRWSPKHLIVRSTEIVLKLLRVKTYLAARVEFVKLIALISSDKEVFCSPGWPPRDDTSIISKTRMG